MEECSPGNTHTHIVTYTHTHTHTVTLHAPLPSLHPSSPQQRLTDSDVTRLYADPARPQRERECFLEREGRRPQAISLSLSLSLSLAISLVDRKGVV